MEEAQGIKWRRCEKLVDGQWQVVQFEDLKIGDQARLYEDGGLFYEGKVESVPIPTNPPGNFEVLMTNVRAS